MRTCFYDSNGAPLAGGKVYSYQATTTTPLDTFTDGTSGNHNTNPVTLDTAGCAQIWVNNVPYKFIVKDSSLVPQFTVDNVTEAGLSALAKSVLLAPAGGANQTVSGPLTVTYLTGSSAHTTSPGIRVSILAPTTVLDSASNPPNLVVTSPAVAAQNYHVPDPGVADSAFILSPGQTGNVLDCTAAGISCKRFAYAYFEGAGCNNTTAGIGWDNFGTNAPDALCVTGSNIQKGVMGLRSAATKYQSQTGSGACAATCTLTYPQATIAGDLLVVVIAVDTARTVSSVSDGTNAYTKAVNKTNGNYDVEVWYFNGSSTAMAAGSTLTITLSAAGNAAYEWFAYKDIKTAALLDVTANNSGSGTAVTTGTTAGTAQNTELVISALAAAANPTVTFGSGVNGHSTVAQGANVTVSSSGKISQAAGAQSDSFTLGTSETWAAAIVTFKANVANNVIAQRQIRLPSFYDSSATVSSDLMWQAPSAPTGTVTAKLGAQLVCTAAGSTDDPVFNAITDATATVNASVANTITQTTLTPMTTTGCANSNLLHYQVVRERYNVNDTYEGYIYLNGASLKFGVTQ